MRRPATENVKPTSAADGLLRPTDERGVRDVIDAVAVRRRVQPVGHARGCVRGHAQRALDRHRIGGRLALGDRQRAARRRRARRAPAPRKGDLLQRHGRLRAVDRSRRHVDVAAGRDRKLGRGRLGEHARAREHQRIELALFLRPPGGVGDSIDGRADRGERGQRRRRRRDVELLHRAGDEGVELRRLRPGKRLHVMSMPREQGSSGRAACARAPPRRAA